jgi:uncharacterized membrane protein YhfC
VNILNITYLLNGLLMIAMPVGLTIYLTRKHALGWHFFWIGAGTMIFSQVLHIPFNIILNPVFSRPFIISLPIIWQTIAFATFLGLSAGIFEELSRYIMYRWWAKDARTWGAGLVAGAGHGGIEAIILGILVLYGYVQMMILRGVDIASITSPDKVEMVKVQVQTYWSAPWPMTLLGAVERLFTIPLHLACSVLVLQTFLRKNSLWIILAIIFHALVDGLSIYMIRIGFSVFSIEVIIGIFAVFSVGIVLVLRERGQTTDLGTAIINKTEAKIKPLEDTPENLDKTRFQ